MTLSSLAFDFDSKGKGDRRSIADRKHSIPSITLMRIYIISRVLGDLTEKKSYTGRKIWSKTEFGW